MGLYKFQNKESISWQLYRQGLSNRFRGTKKNVEIDHVEYYIEDVIVHPTTIPYNLKVLNIEYIGVIKTIFNDKTTHVSKNRFYQAVDIKENTSYTPRTVCGVFKWDIVNDEELCPDVVWYGTQEGKPIDETLISYYGIIPSYISLFKSNVSLSSVTEKMVKDAFNVDYIHKLEAISPINKEFEYLTIDKYTWLVALIKNDFNYEVKYIDNFGVEENLKYNGENTMQIDGETYKVYAKIIKCENERGKLILKNK